jgi:hypothetical protein
MGDFALIFQILGGLLAIFFIFLTVMNTKTWRWLHVTALALVFVAVIALMPIAAMTLVTRFNWVKAQATLTRQVDESEQAYRDLVYGNPAAADGGKDALMPLRNEYSRTIVDRGRVLRQCRPTLNPADGTVMLQIAGPAAAPAAAGEVAPPVDGAAPPPADGAVPPDAAAPPAGGAPAARATAKNGFKVQEVVFAFVELPDPTGTRQVPAYYVGQFEVTAATDQSLTLRRTLPAGPVVPAETQRLWTVYETLPPDMHEAFAFPPETRAAELAKLFPPANAGVAAEVYSRMLADYLRDGMPAEQTDPPENVWIKVEFLRDHEIVVDAEVPVSPINADLFDQRGQAQVARLQRNEPVKFKKGDTALFDSETANSMIDNGIAKLGEGQTRTFRRQLNKYENAFATISRRIRETLAEQARVERHLAELQTANEQALEQIKLQEAEKAMLLADVAKVKFEGVEVGKYRDALQNKLAETRSELSRLYNANLQLGKELKALSDRLTDEIEVRTREATAAAP